MYLLKSSFREKVNYILIYLFLYACLNCTSLASERITPENYLYGQSNLERPLFTYDDLLEVKDSPKKLYGPVKKNETIWDIASKLRSDNSITIVHMIVALYKQNPDAFRKKNLNSLLTGVTLVIPDREQINQLSKSEVNKIFLQHRDKWKNNKTNTAVTHSAKDEINSENISTALKTNEITMSRNEIIIAKNKAMMAKIETMLNEIETQIPDKQIIIQDEDFQVSDKISALNEILALPETVGEIKLFANTEMTDNKNVLSQQDLSSTITITDMTQSPVEETPLLWQKIKSIITNTIASNSSTRQQLPVILIFFIVLVIIFSLVLHFIKKRVQVKSIKVPPDFGLEEKYYTIYKSASEPIERVKNKSHPQKIEFNLSNFVHSTNTSKFQGEQQPIKSYFQRQNTTGTLEKVFQKDSFISNKQKNNPGKVKRINPQPAAEIRKAIKPKSMVKPVKPVLEKTGNTKVDAFYEATQSENQTYGLLEQEIDTIKFNENIIFFIEEFEQLITKLTIQSSTLKKGTNKIEKLIQFKISIQSLIELTETVQATQLCYFTQIVCEFLEELIDARIEISIKAIRRLSSVVDFYHRYDNLVKINQYYKLRV